MFLLKVTVNTSSTLKCTQLEVSYSGTLPYNNPLNMTTFLRPGLQSPLIFSFENPVNPTTLLMPPNFRGLTVVIHVPVLMDGSTVCANRVDSSGESRHIKAYMYISFEANFCILSTIFCIFLYLTCISICTVQMLVFTYGALMHLDSWAQENSVVTSQGQLYVGYILY